MVWVPFPVIIPLIGAVLLAAAGRRLPRWANDSLAIIAATGCAVACAALLASSSHGTLVYWFGGWFPRGGVAPGVAFVVDSYGAALALLSAVLTVAAFVFSWHYFKAVGALFHVLMLVFLGALCGFALTGDLFNLFVFFELMGAAAYALCGYESEEVGPLQGAFNFGVTNTIGAFLILNGIALLYARTGGLNMAQVSRGLAASHDSLVVLAFVLIVCGFLIKAAVAPFHFWLADAHAVAPTPVSVLLSGAMVEAGLYGVLRVYSSVFSVALAPCEPRLRVILIGLGTATALLGGVLCFVQSHLKRLLAFSTVSHSGLMLIGVGLFTTEGLGGFGLYALGHGLIKGALFLLVGILLHRYRTVNERSLHGRGCQREMLPTAVLVMIGGIALAGAPPFALASGEELMQHSAEHLGFRWLPWVFAVAGCLTGGAVLRAAASVFLGWGPRESAAPGPGGQQSEPPETEEKKGRVPGPMWLAAGVLIALALGLGTVPGMSEESLRQAANVRDAGLTAHVLDGTPMKAGATSVGENTSSRWSLIAIVLACSAATASLFRRAVPTSIRRRLVFLAAPVSAIRTLQSGDVRDYVIWLTAGLAGVGGLAAWAAS